MAEGRFLLEKGVKEAILKPQNKIIMVLGASDTGKTTLVEDLLEFLLERFTVGVVDADLGQSHIGPPTTIAWALFQKKFEGWKKVPVKNFYFVGATSPAGSLLPTITAVKLMSDLAREEAEKVIVDTTGMIRGGAGRILKICKIELIQPHLLLVLQKEDEVEHILKNFVGMNIPLIFRVAVPLSINEKAYGQRANYRERKFRDYFSNCQRITLPMRKLALTNIPREEYLSHRLVCLKNREGRNLALGIVDEIDEEKRKMSVWTPLDRDEEVADIIPGKIRITLEGKEIY